MAQLIRENVQKHGYHLLLQELGLWPKFTQWICAKHFGSQIDTAQITVHLSSGSACIMDSVAAPLLHSADHAPGPHLGCLKFLIQIFGIHHMSHMSCLIVQYGFCIAVTVGVWFDWNCTVSALKHTLQQWKCPCWQPSCQWKVAHSRYRIDWNCTVMLKL